MRIYRLLYTTLLIVSAMFLAHGVGILARNDNSISYKPREEYGLLQAENKKGESFDPGKPVNIVVLGLDHEEFRSDVIVLINFSPEAGELNILSFARDTRVIHKGKTAKINALVKAGGEKLVIEKIEEMTGLDIQYYITVNFEGFRKIIDTLGGVTMDVPFDMNYDDPEQDLHIHLKKGVQVLDGTKAEQLVRYRKGNRDGQGYKDGDIGRIRMQQEFMRELFNQKFKFKYISKSGDIYLILRKHLKSNIELGDVNRQLKRLRNVDSNKINTYTLPGEAGYINGVWYFIHDSRETKNLINENFFK